MAQRVSITLVDDIDESEADETVTFALDGATYEIDLNAANAARLRETLAEFVGVARKVSGRSSRPSTRSSAASDAAEVRQWAKDNGYSVTDRGRIPADVRAAYEAAH